MRRPGNCGGGLVGLTWEENMRRPGNCGDLEAAATWKLRQPGDCGDLEAATAWKLRRPVFGLPPAAGKSDQTSLVWSDAGRRPALGGLGPRAGRPDGALLPAAAGGSTSTASSPRGGGRRLADPGRSGPGQAGTRDGPGRADHEAPGPGGRGRAEWRMRMRAGIPSTPAGPPPLSPLPPRAPFLCPAERGGRGGGRGPAPSRIEAAARRQPPTRDRAIWRCAEKLLFCFFDLSV